MDEQESRYSLKDLHEIGARWIEHIKAADKREDRWLKDAEAAEAAYLCDDGEDAAEVPDFNILHSNIETIVPSLYNSTPTPDIRPRHSAKDNEAARQVANVYERAIVVQIDDNALDGEIEASTQDAFMAGRGIVRVKFDADVSDDAVTNERVNYEVVSWRDYREGPATRWENVPWVGYRHCISQAELNGLMDDDIDATYRTAEDYQAPEDSEVDEDVWEIWCKDTGKVYFVAERNSKVIKVQDDPLQLTGFFPQCKPVQPITGTGKRIPVCPYKVYKTLAEELDKITRRINAIVSGLKVRGGIASAAESLEDLAKAGDNELVPIADVEGLVSQGGLQNAIVWWPVDVAIQVLRELYIQRDQTKQSIYEITGISDIVRGASNAGETATAQQIKSDWGSLRIKKMQRLIERQVRDLFKITAEIVALHFSPQALQAASGVQIMDENGQILEQFAGFVQKPLDHYRIDVESDSTIKADAARNRNAMSEFLGGTAQFMQATAPLVAQAPQSAQTVIELYAAFARQWNLGKDAEDALETLLQQAQQMGDPSQSPEAEEAKQLAKAMQQAELTKAQADAAKAQAEAQAKGGEMPLRQAEMQAKGMEAQAKAQLDAKRLQIEEQKLALEAQRAATENARAQAELGMANDEMSAQLVQLFATMGEQLAAGQQAIAAMQDALLSSQAELQAGQQAIAAALTAPKEIIRDENGRPIGVRSMGATQEVVRDERGQMAGMRTIN